MLIVPKSMVLDDGKAWQQVLEVAGHIAATVRMQREMEAPVQFAYSLVFSLRVSQPTEWCHPPLRWIFPSQ